MNNERLKEIETALKGILGEGFNIYFKVNEFTLHIEKDGKVLEVPRERLMWGIHNLKETSKKDGQISIEEIKEYFNGN